MIPESIVNNVIAVFAIILVAIGILSGTLSTDTKSDTLAGVGCAFVIAGFASLLTIVIIYALTSYKYVGV